MFYESQNVAGTSLTSGTVLNAQLTGVSHRDKYVAFKALAQRWRLSHMSATIYHDAPALSDQGEIVVVQTPVFPKRVETQTLPMADGSGNHYLQMQCVPTLQYTTEDFPDFTTAVTSPNCYTARSKEGAYVPLKLSETSQDWISESDDVAITSLNALADSNNDAWSYPATNDHLDPFATTDLYPHWAGSATSVDLRPVYVTAALSLGSSAPHGQKTSDMMNANFAHICARNLSPSSSFQVVIRCGIEMQVAPNSMLSPQAHLAPDADPSAIESYYDIVRCLNDGYPASYNDLGKLWDVISNVAKTVIPVIRNRFPAVGKGLAFIKDVGDATRNYRKAKRQTQEAFARDVSQRRNAVLAELKSTVPKANKNQTNARMNREVQAASLAPTKISFKRTDKKK